MTPDVEYDNGPVERFMPEMLRRAETTPGVNTMTRWWLTSAACR